MDRRKFLLGAGSAAIGGSALLGSGAFTRVESQRRVKIEVAEDPDAYLGLEGCEGSPNSSYTNIDDSGHLEVDMSPDNPTDADGQGINSDSRSYFDDVFQICNNGKQAVCVWVEDDEGWPTYERDGQDDERRVELYTGSSMGAEDLTDLEEQSVIGEANALLLGAGDCICVGVATVSKGLSEEDQLLDELDDEITIVADADAECNAEIACGDLEAEYNCTIEDDGEFIGTRVDVNNLGTDATDFGWAVVGEPNTVRGLVRNVAALDSETFTTDASDLQDGIVWWESPEECGEELDLQTYAEFVDERGEEDELIETIEEDEVEIPDDAYVAVIDGLPIDDDTRVICDEE